MTTQALVPDLRFKILGIVCRGKHMQGGNACNMTCGIQVDGIMRLFDAVALAARNEALEKAARVCDAVGPTKWITGCDAFELSRAIRALKEFHDSTEEGKP